MPSPIKNSVLTFLILFFCFSVSAQSIIVSQDEDSAVVIGGDYASRNFYKTFFGEHYRSAWLAPIKVAIIDLEKEQLTPIKQGGGFQTTSLRLRKPDGSQWVFRSIAKNVEKILPEDVRGTLSQDILQDQISASHPYAAWVVPGLAKAAGVAHAIPTIGVVKDSPLLGEFRETFKNLLVLYEQRPYKDMSNADNYFNAKDVENTPTVIEKTIETPKHRVDEYSLARARLFDLILGDIDRHDDQWRWGKFKNKDFTLYRPYPRDRDFAFLKADGFFPWFVNRKWAAREVSNFDYIIDDPVGLASKGMPLDRHWTTRLTREDWYSIADSMQKNLTDKAIEDAFLRWPDTLQKLHSAELIGKLKARRDKLMETTEVYYNSLIEFVAVKGSNKRDLFEIRRFSDDETVVKVYKLKEKSGKKDYLYYERTFFTDETKEIRFYGFKGKDIFDIQGQVNDGIKLRIIGGEGEDQVLEKSRVAGGKFTFVYDTPSGNDLQLGREGKNLTSNDTSINLFDRKERKFNVTAPLVGFGFNVDDGVFLGAGFSFKKYGFRKDPYEQKHSLLGTFAIGADALVLQHESEWVDITKNWDFVINSSFVVPGYNSNFYGLGNETKNLRAGQDNEDKFYHVMRFNQLLIEPMMKWTKENSPHTFAAGPYFQYFSVQEEGDAKVTDRFVFNEAIDQNLIRDEDFDGKNFAGLKMAYNYNTTDHDFAPREGVKLNLAATGFQRLTETDLYTNNTYLRLKGDVSGYLTMRPIASVLAVRLGAATLLGDDFEFYQANSLGGLSMLLNSPNLRGYRRNRFAGNSYFYQNIELRTALMKIPNYIATFRLGIMGSFDNGRVWYEGEDSDVWHQGYGYGIWLAPFDAMVLAIQWTQSKEDGLLAFSYGFRF